MMIFFFSRIIYCIDGQFVRFFPCSSIDIFYLLPCLFFDIAFDEKTLNKRTKIVCHRHTKMRILAV